MSGIRHGNKQGRPRRYDFGSSETYRDRIVGNAMSVLDELLERVVDQIEDLPPEAFGFKPQGVWFALGWLPLHLAYSEYSQIEKTARALEGESLSVDASLVEMLSYGSRHGEAGIPEDYFDADTLIRSMRRIRDEVTHPFCQRIPDAEQVLPDKTLLSTPATVLMHLMWHWTYHSGHLGLMRLEWGSDYEWVMAEAPMT